MRRVGGAGPSRIARPGVGTERRLRLVTVAVFLAYNANNGLPFVPTRSLRVQIANGAELVPGNEVRSGGFRIGVVDEMKPVRLPNGRIGAELHLIYKTASKDFHLSDSEVSQLKAAGATVNTGDATGLGTNSLVLSIDIQGISLYVAYWQNKLFEVAVVTFNEPTEAPAATKKINDRIH